MWWGDVWAFCTERYWLIMTVVEIIGRNNLKQFRTVSQRSESTRLTSRKMNLRTLVNSFEIPKFLLPMEEDRWWFCVKFVLGVTGSCFPHFHFHPGGRNDATLESWCVVWRDWRNPVLFLHTSTQSILFRIFVSNPATKFSARKSLDASDNFDQFD